MNIFAKIGVAAGALLMAQSASATVTITSVGLDGSVGSRSGTINYSPTSYSLNAGIGRLKLTGYDTATLQPLTFTSWCADIFHYISAGVFTQFSPASLPVNAVKLSQLATLLGNAEPLVNSADTAAAVQLAVWEIVFEASNTGYDLNAGDLYVTGGDSAAARTLANTYLTSVTDGSWQPKAGVQLNSLFSEGNQTQLYTSAVPEAASWLMMIGGFGMVGGVLRRRPQLKLAAI